MILSTNPTFFLLFLSKFASSFTPNALKHAVVSWDKADATHASITEAGIKRAVLAYFDERENQGGRKKGKQRLLGVGGLMTKIKKALVSNDKCAVELIDYQEAVQAIVNGNAATDSGDNANRADLHFDAERFYETKANIKAMRQYAKNNVSKNLYPEAREAIGHALHMVQDFYSHSNWVEMGMEDPSRDLVNLRKKGFGVRLASPNTATCKSCKDRNGECRGNIIARKRLTSGYFQSVSPLTPPEKDAKGKSVEKPTNVAKCSHGGWFDKSAGTKPIGGINKDTGNKETSPHHYLHHRAAELAELSTEEFITRFRKDIGNEKFERFLSLGQADCKRRKARSALNNDQTKPTITHSVSSTPSYVLTSGLVHIEWVIFDFATGPLVVPVDSTVDEIVVNITTISQLEEAKTISLTSPNGFQHSFKAICKPAESVYIRIQTPQPGAWRVEITGATGRHSVSVLGSSHWGPIIDLMTVQKRSRHVMRPTMRVISADELISGSIIFAYILTPEEEADVTGVEVRNAHGALIDNLSIAMEPIIEHDFSRRLIEFIVPQEEFRFIIRAKDKNGFDVVRASKIEYKPIRNESLSLTRFLAKIVASWQNLNYLQDKISDNGLFIFTHSLAISASAICTIVLLGLVTMLTLAILQISLSICRPRGMAIVISKADSLKSAP